MTERPRSHQLETESRTALRAALPSAWTIERFFNDYGLDERVEVFDADGRVTGLVFYVQLKATETLDRRRALRVRVDTAHLKYWNKLLDPVLLVLWHAPSKALFWRWAHHHHPFEGHGARAFRTEGEIRLPSSSSVQFSTRCLWNSADPDNLVAELHHLNKVRLGSMRLPIFVGVTEFGGRRLKSASIESLVANIRERIDSRHIQLQPGREVAGQTHLYIGEKYFHLRLGRLNLSFSEVKGAFQSISPVDVGATLGLALSLTGSVTAGVELLGCYGPSSIVLRSFNGTSLALLLRSIVHTGHYEVGLGLLEAWHASGSQSEVDALMPLARQLYCFYGRLSELVLVRLESFMELIEPGGGWRDIPSSAAMVALAGGLFEDAQAVFDRLIKRSGGNDKADVRFVEGAAKAEFALGQFHSASDKYQVLLKRRGQDIDSQLRLARCYLLMGQYRAALDVYEVANDPRHSGEIRSAKIVATIIVTMAGDQQIRRSDVADEASREMLGEQPDLETFELFCRCLNADAVSPNTWRIYSALALRRAPIASLGPLSLLITAFVADYDIEWFTIAAIEAYLAQSIKLFALIAEYALERFNGRFVDELLSLGPPAGSDAENLRGLVEGILAIKKQDLAVVVEISEIEINQDMVPAFSIRGDKTMPVDDIR